MASGKRGNDGNDGTDGNEEESKREKVLAMQCEGALSFCVLDTGRGRTRKPCFVELSGVELESGG